MTPERIQADWKLIADGNSPSGSFGQRATKLRDMTEAARARWPAALRALEESQKEVERLRKAMAKGLDELRSGSNVKADEILDAALSSGETK